MPRQRLDSDSVVAVLGAEVHNLKKQQESTDEAIGALAAEVSGLRVDIAKLTTTIAQIQVKPEVKSETADSTKLVALLAASFGVMQVLAEVIKALIHH